jgi:hypothetical protein
VDPGGCWLPYAGRCPAVQELHGAIEVSSEGTAPGSRLSEQPRE